MRTLLLTAVLGCLVPYLPSQDEAAPSTLDPQRFVGHWAGRIERAGLDIDLDLAFTDGAWSGDLSIPVQQIANRALKEFRVQGDTLFFEIEDIPGRPTFVSTVSEDGNTLSGTFIQNEVSFQFSTTRGADAETKALQLLDGFDAWAEALIEAWEVPGMGVAIIVDHQLVHAAGYGKRNVAEDLPVTPDTLFAIGSSTKAFTAFAAMSLVEADQLDLDAPVRDSLPKFDLQDKYAASHATTRDLLTHRIGLPRHDLSWYGREDFGIAAIAESMAHYEPTAELRTRFQYNNLAFATAGHLIGVVSGSDWEAVVRKKIFEPLNMTRANFWVGTSQSDPDHALPFEKRNDAIEQIPFRDIRHVGPAGSINASVRDMAQWVRVHLGGGTVDGTEILSGASIREMHTPQMSMADYPDIPEVGPSSYGLGWMLDTYRGHYRVHHGGNIDGFSSLVSFLPLDGIGFVVLTNRGGTPIPEYVVRHLADRLLELEPRDFSGEALGEQGAKKTDESESTDDESAEGERTEGEDTEDEVAAAKDADDGEGEDEDEPTRVKGTSPAHPLKSYVGNFAHPGYGKVQVTLNESGDALVVAMNSLKAPLEHWHFEVFRTGADPEDPTIEGQMVQFETSEEGAVVAVLSTLEPMADRIRFARAAPASLTTPKALDAFVGDYEVEGVAVKISRRGKQLVVEAKGRRTLILLAASEDTFDVRDIKVLKVKFVRDEEGEILRMEVHQPGEITRATRKKS